VAGSDSGDSDSTATLAGAIKLNVATSLACGIVVSHHITPSHGSALARESHLCGETSQARGRQRRRMRQAQSTKRQQPAQGRGQRGNEQSTGQQTGRT
jgi:hypothetical protein